MSLWKRSLLIVVVVLVGGALTAYLVRNAVVRSALEDASERSLGVPTALASVRLDLMGQSLSLSDYRASNPDGFGDEPFLTLGRGHVEVDGGSVLSDRVRIPRIEIEAVRLNLTQKGREGNYSVVLDNIGAARASGGESPTSSGSNGRKIVVDEILVRDMVLTVHAEFPGTEPLHEEVSLGEIRLRHVSSDEGVSLEQLFARLVQGLVDRGLANGGDRIPQRIASQVRDRLGSLPQWKQVESGAEAVVDSVGRSIAEDALDAAGDLLRGGSDESSGGGE